MGRLGRLFWSLMALASLFGIFASCGGSVTTNNTSGTTGSGGHATATAVSSTSSGTTSGTGGAGTGGSVPDAGPDANDAGGMCTISDSPYTPMTIAAASCASPPPPGAAMPSPPKAYTGGTCPMLVAYDGTDATYNNIMSMGNARSFALAVPSDLQPGEHLPVIFLWYWLKGSAQDFYTIGDVQNAVNTQRFLAVIPNAKGDIAIWNWPFSVIDSTARQEEEYTFFDDMLSCVAQQFNVNTSCVSSAGISAGALFTDQLVGARSDYLSSFLSLSGGVGGPYIKPYASPPPPHAMPGMVLWGGPSDNCVIINFQTCSENLEADLKADCNFVVECIHNCGHGEPPFDLDAGGSTYAGLWQFALDHPYWLPAGTSPYTTNGLPSDLPAWCAVGIGNAVPRTGMCNPPGCM
jgi:hypothetical protein